MNKYLQAARVSLRQEIAYPMNFIMWRFRNVIQILLVYFLWNAAFSTPGRVIYGYDREKILTYIFGIIIVRAFVLSSKTSEVSGEISRGELSNSLVKPINYFKYWLSRDLASKALNLAFAAVEIVFLVWLFRVSVFYQTNPAQLALFVFSVIIAILTFTTFLFIVSTVSFWMPEMSWAAQFLLSIVVVEFLSGALFPLDILPRTFQTIINLTPFPYLVFFPLQIYLGKIQSSLVIQGLVTGSVWLLILYMLLKYIWSKGLKNYEAYGR